MSFRSVLAAALLAVAAVAPAAAAPGAAEHIAMGDRDRSTNPASALRHYEAALAADGRSYEALTRAAGSAVDAGEGAEGARRTALYKQGEQYARRATEMNPADAEGHFELARALGRTAQTMGPREKVKYAADVRTHALEALRRNSKHAGALHVMGMWNAEIMRLNGMSRFMAKNFLGGKVFDTASWEDAQRFLEQAVAVEPNRLVHRVDLAGIYADRGNAAKAREQIDAILRAPASEPNDARYKQQAQALSRKL